MRQKIELVTMKDIEDFAAAMSNVSEDVRLEGKDENGAIWSISGKSKLAMTALCFVHGKSTEFSTVDWNTVECVCDNEDIYEIIKPWVVGSMLDAG